VIYKVFRYITVLDLFTFRHINGMHSIVSRSYNIFMFTHFTARVINCIQQGPSHPLRNARTRAENYLVFPIASLSVLQFKL